MDNSELTFQTWNKVASMYQDKFMDVELYDDTYDTFCSLIDKSNPTIFEVGCGPGNITKYLLSKKPDCKITAIDAAPNMIKLAKQNNPAVDFKIMDGRNIDILTSKFDAIMCGFCMPYLSKEECIKLMRDCSTLLKDNGIFYFSVIEDDYNKSAYETSSDGQHTVFVYYHEEKYLREYLEENNFELINLIRKVYQKTESTTSTHLIIIAKKK